MQTRFRRVLLSSDDQPRPPLLVGDFCQQAIIQVRHAIKCFDDQADAGYLGAGGGAAAATPPHSDDDLRSRPADAAAGTGSASGAPLGIGDSAKDRSHIEALEARIRRLEQELKTSQEKMEWVCQEAKRRRLLDNQLQSGNALLKRQSQ